LTEFESEVIYICRFSCRSSWFGKVFP